MIRIKTLASRARFVIAASVLGTVLAACQSPGGKVPPGEASILASWNEGEAKSAIVSFVTECTDPDSPNFVPPAERIAVFDQDGTLWVEHPVYTQLVYCLDRVSAVVRKQPELARQEPFRTVLWGDRAAIAALTVDDLKAIAAATLSGMTVEEFAADVRAWLAEAKHPRWNRSYLELVYQPMLELLEYLRAHGFRTFIVTGGGQDFVRVYAEAVYGVPPEQVVGSAGSVALTRDAQGRTALVKQPKLFLLDDGPGKPEGIHFAIGRRPILAAGNSSGDREMLEYASGGARPSLCVLVLHDDAEREFAYGPARGLPATSVGTFPPDLDDLAKRSGWRVISMREDWARIFAFDGSP